MGKVIKVSGPLVVADGLESANMADVVRVGEKRLIGEILNMTGGRASIQVYEETGGLGPGLIGNIYDGIQRPLEEIMRLEGPNITRGVEASPLPREKQWTFTPTAAVGSAVTGGDVLGTVPETESVLHRIMVPNGLAGELVWLAPAGDYTIDQIIARVRTESGDERELTMTQKWPVRVGRPFRKKFTPSAPLQSGQRVIDTMFPIAKGGTAAVPGPFGSGKTVVQHQLAKWSDVDIVVYIGCGERGNEMTDVLREFPELTDPRTGQSLMKRTVLIANTSDMPVAAREASVYTGITIAEYFRDMGYDVAVIADSTSRWAEALREMSGRLEEMPGEEGYPRHFPAINWLNSYSLYLSSLRPWFDEHLGVEFMEHRDKAMHMLQQESDLQEIVQLVGKDALSPGDQLTLEVARMLREDFLQQNAFMDVDSYTSFDRQERMLSMILRYDELAREAIAQGAQIDAILELPVRTSIAQTKYEEPDAWQTAFDGIDRELAEQMRQLTEKAGEDE